MEFNEQNTEKERESEWRRVKWVSQQITKQQSRKQDKQLRLQSFDGNSDNFRNDDERQEVKLGEDVGKDS